MRDYQLSLFIKFKLLYMRVDTMRQETCSSRHIVSLIKGMLVVFFLLE